MSLLPSNSFFIWSILPETMNKAISSLIFFSLSCFCFSSSLLFDKNSSMYFSRSFLFSSMERLISSERLAYSLSPITLPAITGFTIIPICENFTTKSNSFAFFCSPSYSSFCFSSNSFTTSCILSSYSLLSKTFGTLFMR